MPIPKSEKPEGGQPIVTGAPDSEALAQVEDLTGAHPVSLDRQIRPRTTVVETATMAAKSVGRISFRAHRAQLRLPVALLFAFIAQYGLERRGENLGVSIIFYLGAAALVAWAAWAGDFPFRIPIQSEERLGRIIYRPAFLGAAGLLSVLTLIASGGNTFRTSTIIFWSGALLCLLAGLWEGDISLSRSWDRFKTWLEDPQIRLTISSWSAAVVVAFGFSAWFRFAQLATVPSEMFSDHAEKLLDLVDVLNGRYSIFFIRNTGREAIQFYLAAATAKLLGTGVSFMTLKIGTALVGVLTLPFIYLLGREVGGRRVGLAAMVLAGVGYWPNVISRIGLRWPLYPLFVAPAFYYLARGIRLRRRNDLLLCGLAMGIGLHGYTPAWALPIAVVVAVAIVLLHRQTRERRWELLTWLLAACVVALVVYLPLLRAGIDMPGSLAFRTLTRVGEIERPLPGSALSIFVSNVWNALRMIGWDDSEVWVNSIPHRPALDWLSAAMFHLGAVILLVRYVRRRNWLDLFILLSIPILMLPSILSLAFPSENPATNRAAGAIVPVFVVAAVPLALLPDWAQKWWSGRRAGRWAMAFSVLFVALSASMNYRLVFRDFAQQYRQLAWNTSDAGRIIKGFADSVGSFETAHIIPYPYWMDTRLPAIIAGHPTVDLGVWPGDLGNLPAESRAQLFIVNPQDTEGINRLSELFPTGTFSRFVSPVEGHDFLVYLIPATEGLEIAPVGEPQP